MSDALPPDRLAWFREARYGLFVHWGLYSLVGRGEWAISRERTDIREHALLAGQFSAGGYDPRAWARMAREAGMRYVVLTTKHHEGFCLWDSKVCAFNAVNSAARRDLVAEFVDAVRAEGLKVGLYYSLGDWHNQDWFRGWQGDDAARERFMQWTHALVRELMTDYGRIDILWYDLPQCYTPEQWRAVDLNQMVRQLQPHILINNRAQTSEDFGTPEQHIKADRPGRCWEACMTLNKNWGYCPSDTAWKSPKSVALSLAQVAAGGGNLLLNVGPDGEGRVPEVAQRILGSVGEWLGRCGEAIYPATPHALMWYHFGPTTVRGNTLYCFLDRYHGSRLIVGGLLPRVLGARWLNRGQDLPVQQRGPQTIVEGLPEQEPEDVVQVVAIDLDAAPAHDISSVINGADIFPWLP